MNIYERDNQIEITAPAKINLFLELTAKRTDGFHEIETVMSSVSVFDRLRFTTRRDTDSRLAISFCQPGSLPLETDPIPTDERNLIQKTIQLVRSTAQAELGSTVCTHGFDIELQKRIPSAAGLGGASSNAAAALVAANRLWRLNWPLKRLSQVAAQLGSDIPFFLLGGTAICTGRGEIVQPIPAPANISVVIAKPAVSLSTAKVFSTVNLSTQTRSPQQLIDSIQQSSIANTGARMFNRLQQFAEPMTDQIGRLVKEFSRLNCVGHQMSGSGSSYFGVFSNFRVAKLAAERLSSRLPDMRILCSHTLGPATR